MPVVSSAAPGTPCWVDLTTSDLGGATAFYGALLGWSFEDQGPEFGSYHMARRDGHLTAGLGPLHASGDGAVPRWSVYLCTEDAEASAQQVVALGGSVLQPPMDVGAFGRIAVVADPGGAAVGLWQGGTVFGFELRDAPGGVCWSEVNTRKGPEVTAFFASLTGFEPKKIEGMDYWALHSTKDLAHFGVLQMTPEWGAMPPHWMAYFAVADIDAAVKQVTALEGVVRHGPFDSPYGRMAVCSDPQGAAFTLIQLHASA